MAAPFSLASSQLTPRSHHIITFLSESSLNIPWGHFPFTDGRQAAKGLTIFEPQSPRTELSVNVN